MPLFSSSDPLIQEGWPMISFFQLESLFPVTEAGPGIAQAVPPPSHLGPDSTAQKVQFESRAIIKA